MAAAPVHLLITQEMALIDPGHMDPNKSGFRQTLRENAAVYRTHVRSAYDKAMNDRNNMEVFTKIFTDTMGSGSSSKTTWWWRDKVTGQEAVNLPARASPKRVPASTLMNRSTATATQPSKSARKNSATRKILS